MEKGRTSLRFESSEMPRISSIIHLKNIIKTREFKIKSALFE
jgi:hypothetical protein